MSVFTDIDTALNTKLKSATALFIQWPNTEKPAIDHTMFVRPTNMPALSQLETLAGSTKYVGVYQIDIFCPLDEGTNALTMTMDDLADYFTTDRVLTAKGTTVFIRAVDRGLAERQGSWYVGFISINYICYS